MTAGAAQTTGADWNPGLYARFRAERLRPATDLLMRIETPPAGGVFDLGCGDGAILPQMRARFPKRQIIGVDASPAMLERARGYDRLVAADIGSWQPDAPAAVIFSNAALHWLDDHDRLLPRLIGVLEPLGVLAVQMPGQFLAPSHALLRDLAGQMFPDRFDFADRQPPVRDPADYARLLAPLGTVDAWETTYVQWLEAGAKAHPVREFTASTAMRPFLEKLTPSQAAAFTAAYDRALQDAYPVEGPRCLFPFRRVFFTVRKKG